MADHCIHESDWGAIQVTVDHLSKEIDGNGSPGLSKTVPVLIKSVDDLNETVGDLRTVISGFSKFQSEYSAVQGQKDKGFNNFLKTAGVIIAFVGLLATFLATSNKQSKEVEGIKNIVDQYGYDMYNKTHNRGDSINIQ